MRIEQKNILLSCSTTTPIVDNRMGTFRLFLADTIEQINYRMMELLEEPKSPIFHVYKGKRDAKCCIYFNVQD